MRPVPFVTFILLGQGLKATIESIDNRADFRVYMQNYAYAHGGQAYRGPRREGPMDEGFVSVKVAATLYLIVICITFSAPALAYIWHQR